jgi:cytochrome P450
VIELTTSSKDLEKTINHVDERHNKGINDGTVFDEILNSNLSDYEKRPERLLEESQNVAVAGTETTAWTLSVLTFHLLSNPDKLKKLRAELEKAIPDVSAPLPPIKDLEQLPYLTAVVSEGLRLGMGTSNRQERVAPDEAMRFNDGKKEWVVPPGVCRSSRASGLVSGFQVAAAAHFLSSSWSFCPEKSSLTL